MKRKRKSERRKIKDKLDKAVKTFVKIRDNYTCQHCGSLVKGSACHGSHVIPVSQDGRLAFDPQNLKVLCFHCHRHFWHLNPVESGKWFMQKFPDRWVYLQEEHKKNEKLGAIKMEWYEERLKTLETLIKGYL